jgi:hypothetical protein
MGQIITISSGWFANEGSLEAEWKETLHTHAASYRCAIVMQLPAAFEIVDNVSSPGNN